jgi:uncharacterized protein (DUF2236 family)
MLRREPSPYHASVPDLELGIAVTLLLIGIVLTAFFVPGLS